MGFDRDPGTLERSSWTENTFVTSDCSVALASIKSSMGLERERTSILSPIFEICGHFFFFFQFSFFSFLSSVFFVFFFISFLFIDFFSSILPKLLESLSPVIDK